MFKKRSVLASVMLLLIMTLLFLSGCGGKAKDTPVSVGSDKNGQAITVKQQASLAVRLESNPTTGFRWELAQCDKSVLMPQGEPVYEAAKSDQLVMGGGGWETFQFKPQKTGQTHLKLIYHRTFEKDVPPAQVYDLDVTIE